jgi:hypothetical protein
MVKWLTDHRELGSVDGCQSSQRSCLDRPYGRKSPLGSRVNIGDFRAVFVIVCVQATGSPYRSSSLGKVALWRFGKRQRYVRKMNSNSSLPVEDSNAASPPTNWTDHDTANRGTQMVKPRSVNHVKEQENSRNTNSGQKASNGNHQNKQLEHSN